MKGVLLHGTYDRGAELVREVRDADIVVVNHHNGTWSLVKNRFGPEAHKVPWDRLPSDAKRAVRP